MKKQKVLCYNSSFRYANNEIEAIEFEPRIAMFDYDAVIIDTYDLIRHYYDGENTTFENKTCLSMYQSKQIQEDYALIRGQIIDYLKQGKNVYVLMGSNEECVIYTGEKSESGTGRNTRTTNYVKSFDIYSFLPVKVTTTLLSGTRMSVVQKQPYNQFFQEVADAIGYDVYFEGEDITTPLAYIAGTNNIVSAEIELFSGRLVLLPSILTGEYFHNKEEWKEKEKNFINKLLELNRRLLFSTDEYIPTWVTECFIPGEKDCIREAEITKEKIIEFEQRLKFQTTIIKDKQQYKKLLYSQGKSLELIVQKVFEELGFTIKDKLENRDDLIAEYDNIRIVCEVKGLTKSAAEKNAAQLEKWVSTYIENNEVVPKGILVVNGFKDKPLDQRVEEVFPDQMIPYCVGRGHLLLTTTQLLCLYLDCKEHEDIKDDVIKEMLNCVGRYPKYMNYKDYIINEK